MNDVNPAPVCGTRCVISVRGVLFHLLPCLQPLASACLLRRGQRAASSKQRMALCPLCTPPCIYLPLYPSIPLSSIPLSLAYASLYPWTAKSAAPLRRRAAKPQLEPPDGVLPN
jgi:hypothetical protein